MSSHTCFALLRFFHGVFADRSKARILYHVNQMQPFYGMAAHCALRHLGVCSCFCPARSWVAASSDFYHPQQSQEAKTRPVLCIPRHCPRRHIGRLLSYLVSSTTLSLSLPFSNTWYPANLLCVRCAPQGMRGRSRVASRMGLANGFLPSFRGVISYLYLAG